MKLVGPLGRRRGSLTSRVLFIILFFYDASSIHRWSTLLLSLSITFARSQLVESYGGVFLTSVTICSSQLQHLVMNSHLASSATVESVCYASVCFVSIPETT